MILLLKFAYNTDLRSKKTIQKCKLCWQCFFRKIDENYARDDNYAKNYARTIYQSLFFRGSKKYQFSELHG